MNSPSDESLAVRYLQAADRDALVELVNRYQQPIFNYLLRVAGDTHRAEEAAQETFLRMLRFLPSWRSELPFRPWIYRIALNTARTLLVREARRIPESIPAREAPTMDASEALFRKELRTIVEELPPDQKEALVLHYHQALSHSEVADVLEIPAGTVATRIHQALTFLRGRLAATGIAVAIVALENSLKAEAAVAAPPSIMSSVLLGAPKTVVVSAGAAAGLGIGGLMASSKSMILMVVATFCLLAGGLLGYKFRAARGDSPGAIVKASESPRPRSVDAQASNPGVAKQSDPGASKSAVPPAPPAVPPTKVRRVASRLLAYLREFNTVSEPRNPTPAESLQLLKLVTELMKDPEFVEAFDPKRSVSGAESAALTLAMLEEIGAVFSDPERRVISEFLADAIERQRAAEAQVEGPLDKLLANLRGGLDVADALASRLNAGQREKLGQLDQMFLSPQYVLGSGQTTLGTGQPGLQGFILTGASPAEMVPALIESWSQSVLALTDAEKVRLNGAAVAHVQRLSAVAGDLESKYGSEFMKILVEQVESNRANTLKLTWAHRNQDPKLGRNLQEASLRLLEVEQENRRAMALLLPERAAPIVNGPVYVWLVR